MILQRTAAITPLLLLALALPAMGEAHPMSAVYNCQTLTDDTERLRCFDLEITALRSREVAGEVQTIDMASIETIEKEAFGLSLPSLPAIFRSQSDNGRAQEAVSEITSAIRSARIQNVSKKLIVVLENGQTWEQTDTVKINPFVVRKAKEARIKRASLGSFMMTIDGSAPVRVKRTS